MAAMQVKMWHRILLSVQWRIGLSATCISSLRKRPVNHTSPGLARQLFPGKIPREQGFIVLQGLGQGQLVEDIPQIGVRFQLIGLGGLDQVVEQRTGLGAFGGAGKEPFFFPALRRFMWISGYPAPVKPRGKSY